MPTYCYSDGQGRVVERTYAMGKAPRRIRVKGVAYEYDLAATHSHSRSGGGGWPTESYAMAIASEDVGEARRIAAEHGHSVDFVVRGATAYPVMRSRDHRRQHMRIFNYYDRNAGYGDQARQTREG